MRYEIDPKDIIGADAYREAVRELNRQNRLQVASSRALDFEGSLYGGPVRNCLNPIQLLKLLLLSPLQICFILALFRAPTLLSPGLCNHLCMGVADAWRAAQDSSDDGDLEHGSSNVKILEHAAPTA